MTAAVGTAAGVASVSGHIVAVGNIAATGYILGRASVTGISGPPPPPPFSPCGPSYEPFTCPTADNIVKMWPRGRAWPITHDPSTYDRYLAWRAALPVNYIPKPEEWPAGFVMAGYTKSIIDVMDYTLQRLCALREEFWCATTKEDLDLWMQEYGLPDPCDPFPELCVKVSATGGQTCEYFQEIAGRAGWGITCESGLQMCGFMMGCTYAGPGALAGGAKGNLMVITVSVPDSPTYHAYPDQVAYAGCFFAGHMLGCGPKDIIPLQCLIERIMPAHVEVDYVIAQ